MNLNELRDKVHANSVEKGFWDAPLSNQHYLMLVITELSEAVEADRKSKRADVNSYKLLSQASIERTGNPKYFNKTSFNHHIKDSVEDELADAFIRLLDLAGARSFGVDRMLIKCPNMDKTFTENIFRICTEIAYYKWSMEERINFALLNIKELCSNMDIDLMWHVEQKMKYNQSRERLHGKKY